MAQKSPKGECTYCGRSMTRGGMSRHLRACDEREQAIEAADEKPGPDRPQIHLQVQDAWSGAYWLHLEIDGSATLEDLDRYLRAIWLECCGHLSAFFAGRRFVSDEVPGGRKAARALEPGVELTHIYDFGSSSETKIKARDVRRGKPTVSHPIALMARNDRPEGSCMECEREAERLCLECVYEHDMQGGLCEEHADTHPHDAYGPPLPIVNSPRTGMCGYTGPAEPPY